MKGKTAVVYYSCSGSTKRTAEIISQKLGADIREIVLEKAYTKVSAYTKGVLDGKRGIMPRIKTVPDVSGYDNVLLGFPIWAWTLPSPIFAFLKIAVSAGDLSDKLVVPFCTDGGNMGKAFEVFEELTPDAEHGVGHEFSNVGKYSDEELGAEAEKWLLELGLI